MTTTMTAEFAFLGASAGGLSGFGVSRSALGTATGIVSGATLGAILGSHITNDTYVVVADVTLGVPDPEREQHNAVITFGDSERKESQRRSNCRPFRQRVDTAIAVYAGGRNVRQAEIAGAVQQRFVRIRSDVL